MCIPSSTNLTTIYDPAHCALRHLFEYVTYRALVRWRANGSVKSVDETVDWSVDKSSVRSEDDKSTDGQIISILLTNPRCTLEEIAKVVGFTKRGVEKAVRRLRLAQRLRKVGGKRFGHWEVIG